MNIVFSKKNMETRRKTSARKEEELVELKKKVMLLEQELARMRAELAKKEEAKKKPDENEFQDVGPVRARTGTPRTSNPGSSWTPRALVNLVNRFNPLISAEDEDEVVVLEDALEELPPQEETRRRKKNKRRGKKRIRLFADSQGRGVAAEVLDLGVRGVTATCKPGTGIAGVLKEMPQFCEGYGPDDCVVIVAGCNDTTRGEGDQVPAVLRQSLERLKQTNVLVCTVPRRHDAHISDPCHKEVTETNRKIKEVCKELSNVRVFDLAELGRGCYTRHGYHLNAAGKKRIAEVIFSFVHQ